MKQHLTKSALALALVIGSTELHDVATDFNGHDGDDTRVVLSYAFPPRLEIFNLNSNAWEAPIGLSFSPRSVSLDGGLAYVAGSDRLATVNLTTGTEQNRLALTNVVALDISGPRLLTYSKAQDIQCASFAWRTGCPSVCDSLCFDAVEYGCSRCEIHVLLESNLLRKSS
jgi:hypothetical protein